MRPDPKLLRLLIVVGYVDREDGGGLLAQLFLASLAAFLVFASSDCFQLFST